MYSDNKQIRDVADVAARIMAGLPPLQEKLHPNQQKIDVVDDEKIDGKDFAKLRKMKKEEAEQQDEAMSHQAATTMKHIPNPSPALKKAAKDIKPGIAGIRDRFDMLDAGGVKREEVEELDEVSLKTATSAYVKRMGKEDEKSPVKAVKTMDHIAKKHGVVGVARAAKAADKEYGLNDTTHNKRKDFVRGVMAGVKEEVEELDEVKMADLPSTKVQGRSYGSSKPQPSAFDVLKGPKDKELKSIESEKKKKKMSEMVALYKDGGMKAFFESIKKDDLISEEPDSAQFAKELEDQKAKMDGKMKGGDVAKASVQSVKQEEVEQIDEISTKTLAKAASAASDPDADYHYGKSHDPQKFADHAKKTKDAKSAAAVQGAADAKGHYTRPGHTLGSYDKLAHRTPARVTGAGKANKQDVNKLKKSISLNAEATEQDIYVIDADLANGVDQVNIEERMMTEPEKQKKEEMVKSMKKGLAGFKERYGDRAKNVMYATATKNAMKEETESTHYKAGHEYASDHAQDSGFKVTARARKKEMLTDNPHKKGTTEHSDWHRGALDGHQTALDNM